MTALEPAILITTGEPAGIGPDITLQLALKPLPLRLAALGDPDLLEQRRRQLGLTVTIHQLTETQTAPRHEPGRLWVIPERLDAPVTPGRLNPVNASYVLRMLRRGTGLVAKNSRFDAMTTAPVQKSVINDAGIAFSGHTEFLAELTGAAQPVMLLVKDSLRVALVTTHLPLTAVPGAITRERISDVTVVLQQGLQSQFGITRPRILVCGLNPHAGENGHLGSEEQSIITPALDSLRAQGIDLVGPVPADTAFTAERLEGVSAVLAMFHDQGLPVIKAGGFGDIVNVTLGLPIIRTSVDHGTALALAGTGRASSQSLLAAVLLAGSMVTGRQPG